MSIKNEPTEIGSTKAMSGQTTIRTYLGGSDWLKLATVHNEDCFICGEPTEPIGGEVLVSQFGTRLSYVTNFESDGDTRLFHSACARAPRYTVVCPDQVSRHSDPFETRLEAAEFAEWGHCCVAGAKHRIISTTRPGGIAAA